MKLLIVVLTFILLGACGGAPTSAPSANAEKAAAPAKAPDENAALAALKDIHQAQADYFRRNRRYALTLEELTDERFLKKEPTINDTGYDIRLRPAADAASYTVLATPASGAPEVRRFFTNQTGEIRAEQGKDANAQSPLISN